MGIGHSKNIHGLTAKEEIFAQEKAKGADSVDAYETAGYNPGATRKSHRENACKLAKRPRVMARFSVPMGRTQFINLRRKVYWTMYNRYEKML